MKKTQQGTRLDDVLTGGSEANKILAKAGNDLIDSGGGDDNVIAAAGNDEINAGSGSDLVKAGSGDDNVLHVVSENQGELDIYDGGKGIDTLRIELSLDDWLLPEIRSELESYAVFLAAGDQGKFKLTLLGIEAQKFETLVVVVDGVEVDPLSPIVVIDKAGSSVSETISALDGADYQVITGSGNDVIRLGAGDDIISSGDGNDIITIGDGDDVVNAGAGNDLINAGTGGGNDIIDGGPGNDTLAYPSVDNSTNSNRDLYVDLRLMDRSEQVMLRPSGPLTTIGELLGDNVDPATGIPYAPNQPVGYAEGVTIATDVLISIENVEAARGNDILIGNDGINRLVGKAGNDLLYGGDGADRLEGGDDDDEINGEDGDDFITSGAGNDTVDGGAGTDTMILQGNRADYLIENVTGVLYRISDLGGNGDGVDLFQCIEQLVFQDFTIFNYELPPATPIDGTTGYDTLVGTDCDDSFNAMAGDDTIFGYDGGDYIIADLGNDLVFGGDGYDVMDFSNPGLQGITANMPTGTIIDQYGNTDTVSGVEMFIGTDDDDVFNSSANGERFFANGGVDEFNGNTGYDILSYSITPASYRGIEVVFSSSVAGDGVVEIDMTGVRDLFYSVENLTATEYDDILLGNIGNQDFFDGEGGSDLIDGGADFDQLDLGGTVPVYLDMMNYVTAAEVDSFVGGLASLDPETAARLADDMTGFYSYSDGWGNTDLARGIERVVLYRGADDTLLGDNNDNVFESFAGGDHLDGRGGNDQLLGGLDNDTIFGGSGDDFLNGEDDDDILSGGTGSDYMLGGFGADQFGFAAGDGYDTIGDFEVGTDVLSIGGLAITSVSEGDFDGDGALDTQLILSSGDMIDLLFVTGITDGSELL